MSDDDSATATESTIEEASPGQNPFDAIREQTATPDAGAPEATPTAEEQATPSSSTTDQPITPEPIPKNPLAQALATPVEPVAPAKPAATGLPPELAAIAQDPERLKKLVNLEQLAGRQSSELGQLRQRTKLYEGLPDPEQIRQLIQTQEQAAKTANLQVWNKGHPKNADFRAIREMSYRHEKLIAATAPEHQAGARASLEAAFSPEERQQLQAFEAYQRQEAMMSPEERDDRQREQMVSIVRQEIQTMLQYQDQTRQTHDYLAKNPDILGKHRETFEQVLDENTPRRVLAEKIVALQEQLAASTGQRAKDIGVIDTAKAREQITRQNAVVGRDAAAPKAKPNSMAIADEAAANGESPLFALSRARAQHSASEP